LPRINTELHGNKNKQKHSDGCTHPVGARSKGSNGGVVVGLPQRNSSILKQAHINEWKVKGKNKKKAWGEHQRIYIRRSIRKGGLGAVKKWWWIETRASEAKGPFPGGKRVGSWGK
jgi:hypothetical protein